VKHGVKSLSFFFQFLADKSTNYKVTSFTGYATCMFKYFQPSSILWDTTTSYLPILLPSGHHGSSTVCFWCLKSYASKTNSSSL